jgi:hypothetical protein
MTFKQEMLEDLVVEDGTVVLEVQEFLDKEMLEDLQELDLQEVAAVVRVQEVVLQQGVLDYPIQ